METTNYLKFDEERQQLYLDDVTIAETLNIPMNLVVKAFKCFEKSSDYSRLVIVEDMFRPDRPTLNQFQLFSKQPESVLVKEYRVYLEPNNNLWDNILRTILRISNAQRLLSEALSTKIIDLQDSVGKEAIDKWNILIEEKRIIEEYRNIHLQ